MIVSRLEWEEFCLNSLKEDKADSDITSLSLIPENLTVEGEIVAEKKGVLCGITAAEICFKLLDEKASFSLLKKDGDLIDEGEVIARVEGNARALLSAERTALNILYHLSGIATYSRKFKEEAQKYGIEVYDTRKTIPLLRKVEKYAVSIGGCKNHRLSLAEAVFIKDNHKVISGGLKNLLKNYRKKIEDLKNCPLIVEVESVEEIRDVLDFKPDVVILDNFSIDEIKEAHEKFGGILNLEVSGGVTMENLNELSKAGVKRVSTSSLVLQAFPVPFKLELKRAW